MRRLRSKGALGALLTAALVLASSASAWASSVDKTPLKAGPDHTALGLNLLWVIIGAVLVIFMQAGFALVETGFCRAKHAAHVVSTNFAIFGLGFVAFFLVGYAFMFGGFSFGVFGMNTAVGHALIGSGSHVFLWWGGAALSGKAYDVSVAAMFLYMVAFMDTTATIPTGAMAERWKWNAFVGWGLFCGAIYYPLFGAWTWGGGWLSQLGNSRGWGFGYVDFAGSGVVHAMGGIAGLAGAIVLGPRIGKYVNGKSKTLAGHHIPMAMLGCFILLFGWFGFNAASTFAATDFRFTVVAANTAIAAAFGATIAMFWAMMRGGKPDPGMMVNGMLAGLVAITAPCAFVQPWAAAVIGGLAAVICYESVVFIDTKLKIDDPVGAISVHGVCGIFGVLCVGIFSDGTYGAGWNLTKTTYTKGVTGILYGGNGGGQLLAQIAGALTIIVVMGLVAFVFFKLQDMIMPGGIRSKEADEIAGLDEPEMGALAYPEFAKEPELVAAGVAAPLSEPHTPTPI
ncbi:MAG TPA: ammonium transporter [Acidimicrobiales bacterium]|nr:ammonium transporter [Acidimicrobiales bacterium]